jgi:hypothetical protein
MDNVNSNISCVVLGYVLSLKRDRVLMLYHNGDAADSSYGKYNGLSGRLNSMESVSEAMRRVVMAETLAEPSSMELRGVVHWAGFGRRNESLLGHVFLIHGLDGIPPEFTTRGRLQWVPLEQLTRGELPMWSGDEHILPLVFDEHPHPFFGYMPYDHGVPRSWSCERPGKV